MGRNLVQKIIEEHLVSGTPRPGDAISVSVDQILTQDATGTMAYLQFEAMGIPKIKAPLAVSYVDHGLFQADFMNPDDHRYLQSAAAKYGAYFSKPGNGICHQVHLERFAAPGKILLGSDSHTPTSGGMGTLAIGAGGLDVATAMAGHPYELKMPKVVGVRLIGELRRPWVTAMDVILEILRRLTVKGGVGKIMEYHGPGVKNLNVAERATITNMGAELGATTSIFPSDELTLRYLRAQGREDAWRELGPDEDATYDEELEIDIGKLTPLIAKPHSPDNVVPIREVAGTKVDQVCIGSCTNSSYQAMRSVASILRGRSVAPWCSLLINPGSRQVYEMIAGDGSTAAMIEAGARILESACGPCIGMGGAPPTDGVSVRTYNRNFRGRCGNASAGVYLCNPLAAAAIAIEGRIIDPRESGISIEEVGEPERFRINDNMLIPPAEKPEEVEVIRGPNIKEVPVKGPLEDEISGEVLIKVGDNISTDAIMPAGSKILPLRSNIPAISEHVFSNVDETFAARAKRAGGGFIVGGENYGQGSSREHAALAPMYLGVKAVIVKSLARIHRSNLINYGILPLEFVDPKDYGNIERGDRLKIVGVPSKLDAGENLIATNESKGVEIPVKIALTSRELAVLKAGGLLPYIKGRTRDP
ncbi:MAG: aconitate hydratase [bacterium]